ncbi:GGDEF domain-containing protein [Devosia sp.]|uniref:GGDEF domain-containing protein n=1 Tax=Devosia sp. TaxID=1871048 RepID=UPI001ACE0BA6|nr:diguanylate cyclase [Devosia sp.]MBN9335696.1 diguanylate cyclase [Devosia sp.]
MTLVSDYRIAANDGVGGAHEPDSPRGPQPSAIVVRVTLAIAVLWVLLVAGIGFWLSQSSLTEELDNLAASAEYETQTTASIIDRLFTETTSVANMVARQGQVIELASLYRRDPPGLDELTREERAAIFTSDVLVRDVGDYMTGLADDLHYARIYINNLSQDTVASSHWTEEFNIVGQIYAGRAYLLDALTHGRGQMFGIARLNQMPSYFVTSRIEGTDSVPLGSVTVRLDAPVMARYLTGRHIALIVNSQGRVTTASHERFMLRNVAALLPPDAITPGESDEGPGEPMNIAAMEAPEAQDQWLIDGTPYLMRSQPLTDAQYQLVTLAPLDHLAPMNRRHIWAAGAVAVIGLALIALCGVIAAQRAVRRQEERYAANYDALTGLPNRRVVQAELDRFFSVARRAQQSVLVAFIDMDGFKTINDTYGHGVGDRFLAEVSRRLLTGLRDGDMLGRWGGDEFIAISLTARPKSDAPDRAVDLMRNRLAPLLIDTYTLAGRVFEYSGASFGIVCADPRLSTPQATLIQADKLMYADKEARRDPHRATSKAAQLKARFD